MPRTKVAIQKNKNNAIFVEDILRGIDPEENGKKLVETKVQASTGECILKLFNLKMSVNKNNLNKTYAQIQEESMLKTTLRNNTVSNKSTRQLSKRNGSSIDDGYLTATSVESSTRTSSRTGRPLRRSRSQTSLNEVTQTMRATSTQRLITGHTLSATATTNGKRAVKGRSSRSLSRSRLAVAANYKTPVNYKTPAQRIVNNEAFPFVTPKIKPNTPQVITRFPQRGEVAISLQGSPLTVTAPNEDSANVNIPLLDGRIFSINSNRGLRESQVPVLDPEIRIQLETLRENLNKVCAVASRQ